MVLNDLACHEGELSILFTDDRHIADLNAQYLGRKGPTNVLAFPMSGPPPNEKLQPGQRDAHRREAGGPLFDVESGMLGDIVVSVDTAICESKNSGESLEETIYRLLIHGLLHLLNYDHERSAEEARLMEKEQRRLHALTREE